MQAPTAPPSTSVVYADQMPTAMHSTTETQPLGMHMFMDTPVDVGGGCRRWMSAVGVSIDGSKPGASIHGSGLCLTGSNMPRIPIWPPVPAGQWLASRSLCREWPVLAQRASPWTEWSPLLARRWATHMAELASDCRWG